VDRGRHRLRAGHGQGRRPRRPRPARPRERRDGRRGAAPRPHDRAQDVRARLRRFLTDAGRNVEALASRFPPTRSPRPPRRRCSGSAPARPACWPPSRPTTGRPRGPRCEDERAAGQACASPASPRLIAASLNATLRRLSAPCAAAAPCARSGRRWTPSNRCRTSSCGTSREAPSTATSGSAGRRRPPTPAAPRRPPTMPPGSSAT
jgi:hypothetical protein